MRGRLVDNCWVFAQAGVVLLAGRGCTSGEGAGSAGGGGSLVTRRRRGSRSRGVGLFRGLGFKVRGGVCAGGLASASTVPRAGRAEPAACVCAGVQGGVRRQGATVRGVRRSGHHHLAVALLALLALIPQVELQRWVSRVHAWVGGGVPACPPCLPLAARSRSTSPPPPPRPPPPAAARPAHPPGLLPVAQPVHAGLLLGVAVHVHELEHPAVRVARRIAVVTVEVGLL